MKNYKEFRITIKPFIPELVSGILWELEISGLDEQENCLIAFSDGQGSLSKKNISEKLQSLVEEKVLVSFKVEENILEDRNWNEEWEKSINVIEISDKIVVKPSFRDYEPKESAEGGRIVLIIDPKMSFGTGEHPTTKLVLQLLEKYVKKNSKVLDIGTGTGILSIAAVKLGANSVLAIDNDEWCAENIEENIQLNNVESKIKFKLGEINQIDEEDFDLILANIQKDVLMNIAVEIKSKLKKGGIVILSGLLIEDEKDITKKYESLGFSFKEKKVIDEWIALVFHNDKEM